MLKFLIPIYEQLYSAVRSVKRVKLFLSHMAPFVALISVSLALSQTPSYILQDRGYGASALHHALLCGVIVIRALDFCSTGCMFDCRPCAASLVLGMVTACGQ